ncbi:MAG: aspartate--tRNA ligase [Actinomycetota bacterium]
MCGELRTGHAGEEVRLAGWVHRRRDHGGVIFIDLRDREGLVQVVLHPEEQPEAYAAGQRLKSEYVVELTGIVRPRPEGTVNPNLATGAVEVAASSIEVLATAETPPFPIDDRIEASEETRLRYRYLDLRRPEMQALLRMRHRVAAAIRGHFDGEGFVEVETPMLTKSTPEGARDFLVPSRLQAGSFFALPQSPQLFKQLLMISGLDRYYQLVRCFRDEDPRADRQPEFTQLDMEMAFTNEAAVRRVTEGMFVAVFRAALGMELATPFPELGYDEAMARFGTDRPDLRFGLELIQLTEVFEGTGVQVLRRALDTGGAVKALLVPDGASLGRKTLDDLTRVAKELGAGGLAWIAFEADGVSSPLAKVLSEDELTGVRKATGAAPGDLALIVSDRWAVAERVLGALRLDLAGRLGLRPDLGLDDPDAWRFTWITDPPLVEWNETESRWDPVHHPFTSPRPEDEKLLESEPGKARARAYDIVLNGWELGGGSIRIHRPELQRRVFALIGIVDEEAERRFGWFLRAFDFGAPPHGGIALGLDRITTLLAGKESIREAIAFPKTSGFTDLLTGAPDAVDAAQLGELHIRTAVPPPPERDRG